MQKFSDTIATTKPDGTIEVLPSATVTVYLAGTTTPASIYSTNTGTVKTNPFLSAASTGRIEFYAADGRYDLRVDKAGYATVSVLDVLLEDPDNIDDNLDGVTISNSTLSSCVLLNSTVNDVDSLSFSDTPDALTPRRMAWNVDEGTLDVALDNSTTLQLGQELHYRARNATAATIADGAVVWATGTTGASGRISVGLAVADGSQPGKTVMGLMTQATAAGSDGYVAAFGKVRGVNTTGSAVGETWVNGDILYLHPTIPGALTKVKPAVNGHIVVTVAIVIYAGNNGILFARPTADSQEADEIRYTPAGTGAVATTVQAKLRETVSVKDFGAIGNGVADDTIAIETAIASASTIRFTQGTYYVSNGCSVTIGSGKTIIFDAGVKIVSGSSATAASNIFNFSGVADNFKIVGNGVEIYYSAAPTVRTHHTVSITGATITNLEVSGLNVLNSANMGIAVFCGDLNTVASGSKNISIHHCHVKNTLGDGVHVENADSDVRIYDIYGENNQDDVVAIINYTGVGPAATHPTATANVSVSNIAATGVRTSTISLAGVENFTVIGVTESAYSSASVITLKLTHSAGYTVGNRFGVIDNISTSGATKVIALDTPSGGTAYNSYIRCGKLVGVSIKDTALSLSNAGTSGDNKLRNIEFDNIEIVGSGSSAAPAYISQTSNVRINNLHGDTFAAGLLAANNDYFSWGRIRFQGFQSGTSYALNVNTNTNIRPGQLDVNAGNCTSGLIFQSNSGVTHNGLWQVVNATTNYTFGSNTNVVGVFDVISAQSYRASVTSGTTEDINYERVVPSGAKYVPIVTVASNDGLRWGVKNMLNNKMTMVWTDSQSVVFVDYSINVSAA